MMRTAFVKAILDAPDDPTPRLVFADWLDDRGEAGEAARWRSTEWHVEHYSTVGSDARTLHPDDLGTHQDGWTVEGEVHEDWFSWVNDFVAVHPELGLVWGNFESVVRATSKEAMEWDYWDI